MYNKKYLGMHLLIIFIFFYSVTKGMDKVLLHQKYEFEYTDFSISLRVDLSLECDILLLQYLQ